MGNELVFSGKAAFYAASRQSYAPEAIAHIFSQMISPGEAAADVGSGTGILSGEFIKRGYDVFCVEPNTEMRREAEQRYGGNPRFHSIAAPAEHTGLPDGCVSLVTAASAFHWFEAAAFRAECQRILRPNGIVCILANRREYDGFTQAQHAICQQYCVGYTSLTHGVEKVCCRAAAFFDGDYSMQCFPFPLYYTKEKFIARSLSSSYAPERGSSAYDAYVQALRHLLDVWFSEEVIQISNCTVMLWGRCQGGEFHTEK